MKKKSPDLSQHHSNSRCCAPSINLQLNRRRFLALAGVGVAAGTLIPRSSLADNPKPICETYKKYDAMVLSCIDPRMQKPVARHLETQELACKYSQINIAGAAIGAIAPTFKDWHQTFWENLNTSIDLHKIPKIIVINHRQCGAAQKAYGPFEPEKETELHRAVFADFRSEARRHHPLLQVETLLMDLDGSYRALS